MRVVWEGEAGNEGLGESRKDGTEKRLGQASVDLSDCANHAGEGGEDLDGPGSCPDPISFWVHKNPVHIWQDDWGDLGDLSIGQVSREFFQNTDGSLNSEFVACKKWVTKLNLTQRVIRGNHEIYAR